MTTEQFTIQKRWSWLSAVTVEIACDPMAPLGVKLGLAVRVAFSTGADLTDADLTGADLTGADLTGAVLTGAVLTGADLTGADLTGAVLRGEKISRLLANVERMDDPYTFYAFEMEAGGVKIKAGCRWFSMAQYRAHVAAEYADTDKGRETSDILDFIEARCRALGVALEPVVQTETVE